MATNNRRFGFAPFKMNESLTVSQHFTFLVTMLANYLDSEYDKGNDCEYNTYPNLKLGPYQTTSEIILYIKICFHPPIN